MIITLKLGIFINCLYFVEHRRNMHLQCIAFVVGWENPDHLSMQKWKWKCPETNVVFYCTIAHLSVIYQETTLSIHFICSFLFVTHTKNNNVESVHCLQFYLLYRHLMEPSSYLYSHMYCVCTVTWISCFVTKQFRVSWLLFDLQDKRKYRRFNDWCHGSIHTHFSFQTTTAVRNRHRTKTIAIHSALYAFSDYQSNALSLDSEPRWTNILSTNIKVCSHRIEILESEFHLRIKIWFFWRSSVDGPSGRS